VFFKNLKAGKHIIRPVIRTITADRRHLAGARRETLFEGPGQTFPQSACSLLDIVQIVTEPGSYFGRSNSTIEYWSIGYAGRYYQKSIPPSYRD